MLVAKYDCYDIVSGGKNTIFIIERCIKAFEKTT